MGPGANTRIHYLYRDACNYKTFGEVVVEGGLELQHLQPFLYEGEYFVPSQVGLGDLQPEPFTPDDHIWHELLALESTSCAPSVPLTANDLQEAFRVASVADWNQRGVFAEKGML